MLNIGQIFKYNSNNRLLPTIQTQTTQIREIDDSSLRLANYSKIRSAPFIFKTFIQIDNVVATEMNLGYFKTCTINKRTNSYENQNLMTYAKLLNTRQEFDKNNFVSSLYITEKYNILKRDNNLLGRNIRLSDISTKSLIENFSHRKYDTKQFGVDLLVMNNQLSIKKYQNMFFEVDKNLLLNNSFVDNIFDLIIFAYSSNDELLDVVKISDFRLDNINWSLDTTTSSLISQDNLDDLFLSNLTNLTFNQNQFTNLNRQVILSLTSLARSLDLKQYIQEISICENDIEFINVNLDDLLNNPSVLQSFNTLYSSESEFSVTFNYKTIIKSFDNKYFIFNTQYNGLKNYIRTFANDILIRNFLQDSIVRRVEENGKLFLKIDLKISNDLLNYNELNPKFIGMFLNENLLQNQNKISQLLLSPNYYQSYNLNLNNVFLKNLINNEEGEEATTFSFYYLKSEHDGLNSVTFQIEDNNRTYNVILNESYTTTLSNPEYDQKIEIKNSQDHDENFSNLNVDISLKIKDWKNVNSNLKNIITLGYENYINGTITNIDFDNRIFVIVQKRFINMGQVNNQKSGIKYFIFDEDDLNINVDVSTFLLNLNFVDNFDINTMFLKSNQISDHLNLDTNIEYTFESKLLIIPRNFFTTSTLSTNTYTEQQIKTAQEFKEKEEIYNILLQNTQMMHPQAKIDTIHKILSNINQNNFSLLNQLSLKILYENYAIKNTSANQSIILPKLTENSNQIEKTALSFSKENSEIKFLKLNSLNEETINIKLGFIIDSQSANIKNLVNSLIIPIVNNITAQNKILGNIQISDYLTFNNSEFKQNLIIDTKILSDFVSKFNQYMSRPIVDIVNNILFITTKIPVLSLNYELNELVRNLNTLSVPNVDFIFEISSYRSLQHEVIIRNSDECILKVSVNDIIALQ